MEMSYDSLTEVFIRNCLQVPSLSRIRQYFENHLRGKSAICEPKHKKSRRWCAFNNKLIKERPGYESLVPILRSERDQIKDYRHVAYKILSYEVEKKSMASKHLIIF